MYSDYGVRETTVKIGRKYVTIQEKIPDIIVPDLENFHVSIVSLQVINQYNE